MSWYNTYSDTTKKLDQLIDSQPSLQQLLEYPQFLELLKAYQPKLLDYISTSNDIPRDLIRFITQAPAENDTENRKYKLPLFTMLTIETNTICIINSFFKIDPNLQKSFFVAAFYNFLGTDNELLPLLCGYFSQFNLIMWNNRYKQVIDLIYDAKQPLFLLAKHSYSKAIINTLLLYLNLDLTRNNNSPPERVTVKLQIIKQLYDQIRDAFQICKKQKEEVKYESIIENIGEVLIEIIEKYYLISDGKAMLEIITSQQNVSLIIDIFMHGGSVSLASASIVGWLMRYYCLSSFNTEDLQNAQLNKRNQERLQSQPFPKMVIELIPVVAEMVANISTLTLYHSKLIEIFNMSLELSSRKVVDAIKKCKYIQLLISLLFKYPQLSIIHKMVEKAFHQIFNSDRSVFQQYRKYLFCQASLIEITVGSYISKIKDFSQFKMKINCLHEGYFAYLMRIIKIYSKIQTNDEEINKSIMERSAIWETFSTYILQPYQALCFNDLGGYTNILEKPPVQYTIKCITGGLINNQQVSKKVLQEINQEESMQKFKNQQEKPNQETKKGDLSQDKLFNVQQLNEPQKLQQFQSKAVIPNSTRQDSFEHQLSPIPGITIQTASPNPIIRHFSTPETPVIVQPKALQQPEPINRRYEQFLNSKKLEVDKQLKMQRKSSSQKRLSANKSRVTSPSPKKKRWDDNGSQEDEKVIPPKLIAATKTHDAQNKKQKISLTTSTTMRPPMVPHSRAPSLTSTNGSLIIQTKVPENINIRVTEPVSRSSEDIVSSSLSSILQRPQRSVSIEVIDDRQGEERLINGQKAISNSQLVNRIALDNSRVLSKSAVNLSDLKNIQFKKERVKKPQKSEYRKIEEKDRILLDFLGIKY